MAAKPPIQFVKMHGSGNDFVVIHADDAGIDVENLSDFTRMVCRKGTGLGADGIIVIGPSTEYDFSWRYINADGSDGDMCGNGSMVGARYAVDHKLAEPHCTFETPAGVVSAAVDGERVTLQMMNAVMQQQDMTFAALPGCQFDQMMIGVPHVVGFVDDVDDMADMDQVGRSIRYDQQLHPLGANVNLVHVLDAHSIRMRTYERGVEAETLACGTGSVCSAIASYRRGMVEKPVDVVVSSGLRLQVDWEDDGANATGITLTGVARTVAQGTILPDIFL